MVLLRDSVVVIDWSLARRACDATGLGYEGSRFLARGSDGFVRTVGSNRRPADGSIIEYRHNKTLHGSYKMVAQRASRSGRGGQRLRPPLAPPPPPLRAGRPTPLLAASPTGAAPDGEVDSRLHVHNPEGPRSFFSRTRPILAAGRPRPDHRKAAYS